MITSRRRFFLGAAALVAAPAIVRVAANLMPISAKWSEEDALRRKVEFIEKLVRPPMMADPELKNEPASIMPGMITYTRNGGALFRPAFMVFPR